MKNTKKEKLKKKSSLLAGLIITAIYFVFSIAVEMINFKMLGFGIFPTNILFDLAFLFIVCGLVFLIPNNVVKIVIDSILLFVQALISMANSVLIGNTGLVFHLQQLADMGNGAESLEASMINFKLMAVYVLIFVAFLLISILINVKVKKDITLNFKKRLAFWLSATFSFIVIGTSFTFVGNVVRNNIEKEAYAFASDGGASVKSGVYMKNATMKTMGTFGFYFNDLCTLVANSGYASIEEKSNVLEDIKSDIVSEKDAFKIAENNNLIFILLESFDMFAIDPYNTPNLYKLAYGGESNNADKTIEWGYRFDNFHGLNYTNDSELISLVGHTTEKYRLDSSLKNVGVTTPYSLPTLFKNAKYPSVNYFHGYTKEYYNRDELYSAIGFDNVYGLEDANLSNPSKEFGDWVLDSEYISAMMDKFIPEGKSFFSYYASISTHGPYYYDNARFDSYKVEYDKNINDYKKYLESLGYVYPEDSATQEQLRQYKAGVMDVDLMIELIFKELTEKKIVDSTTIVLFSDHNCFYNDLHAKVKNIEPREFENIELYNIPLIIYNNELAKRSSDIFCNTYDLYPTICDMFGFDYNSTLSQGYSIFGDEIKKSVHVSFKHGIFNLDYYTEDLIDIIQIKEKPSMTINEFKTYAYEFFKEQEIVEFVYRNNLFKQ